MSDAQKPFGDKLVVVTGAGSGIGRATALGFAANGARIVAADLDLAAATSVTGLITARGGTAHAWQADVSAAADMERFANWVRTEVGVPDVVINNAGSRSSAHCSRTRRRTGSGSSASTCSAWSAAAACSGRRWPSGGPAATW
jgi:NAD(P)-dependent dehydrogenase (short-subunit alcohol dehydrogenase family)